MKKTPANVRERLSLSAEFSFRGASIRYEWRFVILEDDKKYSDWTCAETCACCGRQIVHILWVAGIPFGRECFASACLHETDAWKAAHATEVMKKRAKEAMTSVLCQQINEMLIASNGYITKEIQAKRDLIRAI